MRFAGINFLSILLIAGLLNLLIEQGWPLLKKNCTDIASGSWRTWPAASVFRFSIGPIAWLFFKTGLLSFGGAYASLVFVERGAVAQYHWLSDGQLLDGVALSVATPGPFMLFTTFVGYLAGGVTGAVLATFFVFLPSFFFVIVGAHYVEKLRDNHPIQAFLAGVSAAVVGVIAVVSLDLIPEALIDWPTLGIAAVCFLLIAFLKRDVALVAAGAMLGGVIYSSIRALVETLLGVSAPAAIASKGEGGEDDVKENPSSPRFHPNRVEDNVIHPMLSISRLLLCALWLRYVCSALSRWHPSRHQSAFPSFRSRLQSWRPLFPSGQLFRPLLPPGQLAGPPQAPQNC